MNESDLRLLEQYIDGTLDEVDAVKLERLLLESPEARAKLRTLAALEFGMQDLSAGFPFAEPFNDAPTLASCDKSRRGKYDSRLIWWSYCISVSLLMLVAALAWYAFGPDAATQDSSSEVIAHLTYQSQAAWSTERELGSSINAERLKLISGLAKLDFANGACVTLKGPAEYEILGFKQTILHSGVLTAHVPESATGFSVETPSIEVVDLGTAFGIAVADDGLTDVSVFEGEVEVNSRNKKDKTSDRRRVTEGQAIRSTHQSDLIEAVEIETEPYEQVWPINSGVLQTTGTMKFVSPGPSFVPGRYEDKEHIIVFPERRGVLLDAPIPVDLVEPGEYALLPGHSRAELPSGLLVRSYLLQFNSGSRIKENVIGQITFDRPILGLVLRSRTLAKTDKTLGHPNGIYGVKWRGIEPPRPLGNNERERDVVILTADKRTLIVSLAKGSGFDQIRVITKDNQ